MNPTEVAQGMPDLLQILERLVIALVMGAAIGFERQWRQKMAGLRTNALVAISAAGFVIFGALASGGTDMRVAAQIVSGVGFLGAGVILREGVNVHGLNTAATLWSSAMVGTLAGGGFAVASGLACVFILIANLGLRPLTYALNARLERSDAVETRYTVTIVCDGTAEAELRQALLREFEKAHLALHELTGEDMPHFAGVEITARGSAPRRIDAAVERAVAALAGIEGVRRTSWSVDRAVPE